MLFYVVVLFSGLSAVTNPEFKANWLIGLFIVAPLLCMFLQEPLAHLAQRKKNWLPKNKGGFLTEAFFELFEIVLSFVTNTISFVRVGAFALNHAGMMSVVIMFMHKSTGASSVMVAIFGNLLVMGLEGLIVGIQVLRLGFYETFGRFYSGTGREFKPIRDDLNFWNHFFLNKMTLSTTLPNFGRV